MTISTETPECFDDLKSKGNACYKGWVYLISCWVTDGLPESLYSQALSFYSDALKLKNDPIVLCNRALVHLKCENFGLALSDSSAAIELNPQNTKVLYSLYSTFILKHNIFEI